MDNLIQEAVKKLRVTEYGLSKSFRYTKYRIPWEIEELREKKETLKIPAEVYGKEITITSDETYKRSENEIVVDIEDWYFLQFLSPKDFEYMIMVYRIFGGKIVKYPDKEYEDMIKYCKKMDQLIVAFYLELRKRGYRGVIESLWKEMGGELIRPDDRLGRRMTFLWRLVRDKKVDKLLKLGFVG